MMQERFGGARARIFKEVRVFLIAGLLLIPLAMTPYAAAHPEERIGVAVEPAAGLTIPVATIESRFYEAIGFDGQETLITISSGTSEPNKATPDTWYIWIRAAAPMVTGPEPIPVSQLYWTTNQTTTESVAGAPLTNQWVRIAVHRGTKHDPPARDTIRIRLKLDKNNIYTAGSYHVVIEYSASHDPYCPQI